MPHTAPNSPTPSTPKGPTNAWTFHILTFGCKVNQYESQAIREAWKQLGGIECVDANLADVALVNSCAVTARGERDARNALYRLERAFPAAKRILTGCSACLAGAKLATPCLDILVPPKSKALLLQGPWQWDMEQGPQKLSETRTVPPFGPQGFSIHAFNRARPVLKVQDGCSHRCTYCIVPLMRGRSVSRPAKDILAEARRLLEAGHGEIVISGINLHHYGRHDSPMNFWDLLRWLDTELAPEWAGRARFRISSLEPTQLTPQGLNTLASCRMICPHVHLSLQNGSPHILRRMGRGHCRLRPLREAVRTLRSLWPHMGLGADILMGFPGETEGDVEMTMALVKELALSYAHVFPYSLRPGTAAASFPDQLPYQQKMERAARVRGQIDRQKECFLHYLAQKDLLEVVLDSQSDDMPVAAGTISPERKGVEAQYAPCRFVNPVPKDAQGILQARPIGVESGTILVEST